MNSKPNWHRIALVSFLTGIGLLTIVGCGSKGPKTYAVKGQIELPQGDVTALKGHNIEVTLENDPLVRAAGQIQENGAFTLETLAGGEIHQGALEGNYKARLVVVDDDAESKRRAIEAINPRYFQFDDSGLSFHVPAKDVVKLQVSPR